MQYAHGAAAVAGGGKKPEKFPKSKTKVKFRASHMGAEAPYSF